MAEMIGELGLETKEFVAAFDRATKSMDRFQGNAAKTTAATSRMEKTFQGLSRAVSALGLTLGAAGIAQYVRSLGNLNEELNKTRGGFVAGSEARKEFDRATEGFGDAQVKGINRIKQSWATFWAGLKVDTVKAVEGFKLMFNPAAWKTVAGIPVAMKDKDALKNELGIDAGGKSIDTSKELLAIEDQIAQMKASQSKGIDDQINLIEKEIELEKKRLELARNTGDLNLRNIENEAKANIGAMQLRKKEMMRQREEENAGAQARLDVMEQERAGLIGVAKQTEIRARYEKEIRKALHDQNSELAAILAKQRDIELMEARRAEHKKTPRERLAERQAARKLDRENRQTDKAEKEFEERWKRGARPTTPGSEFDNWAKRHPEITGAKPNMKAAAVQTKTEQQIARIDTNLALIAGMFKDGGKKA